MGFFFLVGCMVDYNPYQVTLLGIRRVNIIISKIVCLWSGRSVKEFVEACKKATGVQIKVEYLDRRPGDYAEVYSDPSKINRELNWTAQYTDLQQSLQIAWRWQKLHRNGYGGPRLSLISWLAAYCSRILDDESSLCSFVADLLRSIYGVFSSRFNKYHTGSEAFYFSSMGTSKRSPFFTYCKTYSNKKKKIQMMPLWY